MLHLLTGIIRIIHSDVFCPFSIRSGLTSKIVVDLDNSREIIYLAGKRFFDSCFETQAEENFEIKIFPLKLTSCNKILFLDEIIKGQ